MKSNRKAAALVIKRLKLSVLIPHPKNPRQHPEPGTPEWEALRKSIDHDYFDPIIVNIGRKAPTLRNVLVSGHLRTKILIASGFKEADCVIVDYDESTHQARMLAANRLTGKDDVSAIFDLLKNLESIDLTGWDDRSFNELLSANSIPQSNQAIDESALAETNCECPKCGFKWKK